ncbi:bisanhydrobacterioruberin hydratase CruF [Rubrivirga marina]|uniref:Carotenoid biosynthesis protein n=1 Tax=Rubrivirga marina TaxID=1196024 RepID=A0A271J509_9BACT|nr:bisanhydrobacterioruberin hydratase CruF [Rubrivirga marina]PAP77769.1 hypothetical protein BSZ37_15600 [Rubrivirga marina]
MTSRRVFRLTFGLFAATIVFAILGTLSLYIGPVREFFLPYYETLVAAPTWTYMALLPVVSLALYWEDLGVRRSLLFLLAASVIGAASELLGTNFGIPFGEYHYTDRLGAKILGDVPYFIPTSWYALGVLSYDLAGRLGGGRVARALGTAFFMVVWDVSLDPAMNQGGGTFVFWEYPGGGPFYGMPWVNWVGWAVTSIAISFAFDALGGMTPAPSAFVARWAPVVYAVNVLFPISICLLYGLPTAGVIGIATLALALALVRWRTPSARGVAVV